MLNLPDSATIDSLKLRLPDSEVEVISETLKGSWIYFNDRTAEIDESKVRKESEVFSENGITIRFKRESQQTAFQVPELFLSIGINSKILESRYFEGIHSGNLKEVYNYLQNMNIVTFSFESFLKAECVDVDYKRDYIYEGEGDLIESLRYLYANLKPTKHKYGGRIFASSTNVGLEISDRKTTNVISSPFLKFYHKGIELNHHSSDFYRTYLSDYKVESVVRMETTVKNKKHFRYFDINDTSLEHISSLTHEETSKFFDKAMKAHFVNRELSPKKTKELSPNDELILNFLRLAMSAGKLTFGQCVTSTISTLDKVPKSRKKKKLEELYFQHIKGSEVDLKSEKINSFLSMVGFV